MAINTNIPNTTPFLNYYGAATRLAARSVVIPPSIPIADFCVCDIVKCAYEELVFAHTDGEWFKNDKNEFLYKRLTASDTVALELWKNDVKIEDITNNDFGTLYTTFSGSAEQQLYYGFLIDWNLVHASHGVGRYQIKAEMDILGTQSTNSSRYFNLMVYNDTLAHGTVRVESTQNGNIIGNNFDFTGLNWYQSMRIPAIFGNATPIYESDKYVAENRKFQQIQDKMTREFDLNIKKISWEVVEKLIYNKLLANEILMTDYNLYAETIWRRLWVVLKEISKKDAKNNPDKMYNCKFTDAKEFYIKRNY